MGTTTYLLIVAAERRTKRTEQRARRQPLQRVVKNPVICSVSLIIAYCNLQQALEEGVERLVNEERLSSFHGSSLLIGRFSVTTSLGPEKVWDRNI